MSLARSAPTPRTARRPFAAALLAVTTAATVSVAWAGPAGAASAPYQQAVAGAPTASSTTATLEQQEFELLELLNADRAAAGLAPLRMQTTLRDYARHHAADELAQGTIWHDMSEYQSQAPTGWYALGENVAYNSSVAGIHQAYMASPPHRANILSSSYNYVGIGFSVASDGTLFNSEDFMGHADTGLPTVSSGSNAPTPAGDTTAPTAPDSSTPAPELDWAYLGFL